MEASLAAGGPAAATTAEEEALKRNTDCVYFLASPLTCKKGSECEYRHSEGARVNPRDCWYWLNGNCLNPKCSFRHPPLDALFVSEPATEPSAPVSLAYAPSAFSVNKQTVPCYYFQKGLCLKGDKCSFMHGQPAVASTIPQQAAVISPSDPSLMLAKDKVLKESALQHNIPEESLAKIEVLPYSAKPAILDSGNNNGSASEQSASRYLMQHEPPVFESSNVLLSSVHPVSGARIRQSHSLDEHFQNGKEADDFLGESSPGFDVLVDDQLEDNEYFKNEDDYGRAPVQDGRSLNLVNDIEHQQDYEPLPGFRRDQFSEGREYDRYRRSHDRYGREQLRISSERIMDRSPSPEKRMLLKEEKYEHMDQSDLRHRLLKQRRLNGLRSAVSPDRPGYHSRRDHHNKYEDGSRTRHSHRDHRRVPRESSISTRLHGRITLPVKSLPDRPIDFQADREVDRGRLHNRLSPPRSTNYQGRHDDRIKRKLHEDLSSGARKSGGRTIRRDEGDPLDFAGPKSLAELKGTKVSESSQEKRVKSVAHQESKDFLSFEGPKPLSAILKRKRGTSFRNEEHSSIGDGERDSESQINNSFSAAAGSDGQRTSKAAKGGNAAGLPEAPRVSADDEEEEGMIPAEGEELFNGGHLSENGDIHETEDGMALDGVDDQELDDYDQRDGEYDYEEGEDGEFKTEDDENAFQEEEEDDEDDFAKKVSILLS